MSEIILDQPGLVTPVGKVVTRRMAEHIAGYISFRSPFSSNACAKGLRSKKIEALVAQLNNNSRRV